MAHVPVTRAPALGARRAPADSPSPSPYRSLQRHVRARGDAVAFVVQVDGESRASTWVEVAESVERAAAGLIRSGLRADQVVVSLLPAAHPYPELDLALRVIGAIVVHVAPDASDDDLSRELGEVDVRLVVAESEADRERLRGLPFASAELFAVDAGRGWQHLLALGSERLVMDPDVVSRVDQVVDPTGAVPRLLAAGSELIRLAEETPQRLVLDVDDVGVAVGHPADPAVSLAREAHLTAGSTLCLIAAVDGLADLPADLAATHLALAADAASSSSLLAASPEPVPGRRRSARSTSADVATLRRLVGPRLERVLAADLPARVLDAVDGLGAHLLAVGPDDVSSADLPTPPPVVVGDAGELPRRARNAPGRDFASDRLLIAQARTGADDADDPVRGPPRGGPGQER